jgi:hypothetical protein
MLTFDRPLIMKGKRRLVKSAMFRKISIVIPEALRKAIRSSTALSAVSFPEVPGRIHCNDEMLASFSDEHVREYMMAGFSGRAGPDTAGRSSAMIARSTSLTSVGWR